MEAAGSLLCTRDPAAAPSLDSKSILHLPNILVIDFDGVFIIVLVQQLQLLLLYTFQQNHFTVLVFGARGSVVG
jgi:hypothetical protein